MNRTGLAVLLLAVVAAAGCSTEDTPVTGTPTSAAPKDIPPCSELYQAGKVIEDLEFRKACVTDNGELTSPRPVEITCVDDRELRWNDLAWGYVGEPMTLTPADDPSKMPALAVDECLGGADAVPAS
jgi:hypothetical protein